MPGRSFDPDLDAPEVLYLSLPASDICNYRCRHCHIWRQERRPNPLPRTRVQELVREFAEWNPGGTVVLPGGEVTLELDPLLEVAETCRAARLPLILLTNGSRISDLETGERLCRSGITSIVVSLDGHTADLHDYTRGVQGAFESTVAAIRLLVRASGGPDSTAAVSVACVLFDRNLPLFGELVEFCRDLGVRHVDCQLLARTFANAHPTRDPFFERHFWHDDEAKRAAKSWATVHLERYRNDPFVVKKPADLDWILACIDDPDFRTSTPVCGSHRRNLLVDAEGNGALCFNTRAILEQPFVGSAAGTSLRELWRSVKADEDRRVMDACTLNCGALNCHRRP